MVLSKRRQPVLSGGDKSESMEQLQEEPRLSEIPVSVNPKGSTGKEEL